ncbi:hypothetical protein DFA_10775 [Cavenderia fasciculata]|uniref:Transmembrane protein n=1 Tax=Cavenderia fasciculata TaxID=261658 RepID=F4QBD0_CACFS|nr:uncharacterized protein DFA_10775 [Cavenderia fasciculata]EGG14902.1 hypothetical protein DFA_10775 [Cavenderia fasciculata]|eukprot:XP_004351418.1 hypothetical protein DFA_10775 [Cavenderia fasciculata]
MDKFDQSDVIIDKSSNELQPQQIIIPNNIPTIYALFIMAAIFVTIATALSIYLIYQHLKYYTQPEHQRYIVRIVFMIPLYGIYSLLCLGLYDYVVYFSLFRDCYESYALYMFFALCVRYCGGDKNLIIHFISSPPMKCIFPFSCIHFKPNEMGILQYVIVRPIVALVSAILEINGLYDESHFAVKRFYVYSFVLNNLSVTVALFILLLFYQATIEELSPYKPLLKFTSIKIVIFFCFWQSIIIFFLEKMSWLPSIDGEYSISQVSYVLNNFLICFEMFCVSFLHLYAFPYELYRVRSFSTTPLVHNVQMGTLFKSVINSVSQRDMFTETMNAFKGSSKYKSKPLQINDIEMEMGEFKSYEDQGVIDLCDLMNTYNDLNIYNDRNSKPLTTINHYGSNVKKNRNPTTTTNTSILVSTNHFSDEDFFGLMHNDYSAFDMTEIEEELDYSLNFDEDDDSQDVGFTLRR